MTPASQTLPQGIKDNRQRGRVVDFLNARVSSGSALSIVSAYFTIYAYEALSKQLDGIDSLQFLFGEPRFIQSLDPEKTDKKAFKMEDEGLTLANRLQQKNVARRCAQWIETKVEIRSVVESNLLHGKLYHIFDGHREYALMGSSNFTQRGLGLSDVPNIELNMVIDSDRDRTDLKAWFDELWQDTTLVQDVKTQVLDYLAQLYVDHSPEFIYFKTLFHVFEAYLAGQKEQAQFFDNTAITATDIWQTLFEFQKDGAKAAIQKINRHNGCILADSVGLGKTYTALAVIKYFEQRDRRVLVLCPKKLRDNWTVYLAQNASALNPFVNDKFAYTVLSHTDLSRDSGQAGDVNLSTLNWGHFDLVVIDESHNFRNNVKGRTDADGNVVRLSRYERLMQDIIQAGVKTKVMLLSATPVNNDLKDLRNQLYLVSEGQDHALQPSTGIASIKQTLDAAQKTFGQWAKRPVTGERSTKDLMDKLPAGFFTLLDELTIARSRRHIQKYYKASMARIGQFPTRAKPVSVYADIDSKHRFPTYDKLNDEIEKYQLSLFKPSIYVLPQFKDHYKSDADVRNFSQQKREEFLIGMMKVNFLKRLESSVKSFAITMNRTVDKIEALEERLQAFKNLRDSQPQNLQANLFILDAEEDDELREAFEVGSLKYAMQHMDIDRWLADLAADKRQLAMLAESAGGVTPERDAKLAELKKIIHSKTTQPTTNTHGEPNRKVIVFCAFADTAAYLYEQLEGWATDTLKVHIGLVSGGARPNRCTFGKPEYNHILTHFAPRAKQRHKMSALAQNAEIDILIATDCISEGQNLQDCDLLVNYDIHWNPVRIIQRFGRIDRIGSPNASIQLINFWPTPDLNKYINLKNRVEARMALVDIAATNEDNILTSSEIEDLITQDLKYRDIQLMRLRDEVLDLEDFNESVALNQFTLDDFRLDLSNFITANQRLLHDAPLGLYAVVPVPKTAVELINKAQAAIQSGVIYCLRQTRVASEPQSGKPLETVNPLSPFFLVYIQADGTLRYNFTAPKQVLDIFRALCQGQTTPYAELCQLFDTETQHGQDMHAYSALLDKAVKAIVAQFGQKNAANLFSGRGGKLMDAAQAVQGQQDFELVTWLVIK
ncbi:helicase-related protein [Rhodoferax sp.]|uniref:helicase-related protein n=1 Tax=Rhodoferax sp. TaxID=50421 RepID=UPI002630A418|nr:helicase-related protein [Rhodoferax sp.]MDD5479143.1 helicase-related protein [Rhodoferax sp.]